MTMHTPASTPPGAKRTWVPGPKFYGALAAPLGMLAKAVADGQVTGSEWAEVLIACAAPLLAYALPTNSDAPRRGAELPPAR